MGRRLTAAIVASGVHALPFFSGNKADHRKFSLGLGSTAMKRTRPRYHSAFSRGFTRVMLKEATALWMPLPRNAPDSSSFVSKRSPPEPRTLQFLVERLFRDIGTIDAQISE